MTIPYISPDVLQAAYRHRPVPPLAAQAMQPSFVDKLLGVQGAGGLLDANALRQARRQGLLQAGIGMLANADRPNPWQAVQAGLGAGQQAYGNVMQQQLGTEELLKKRANDAAMQQFANDLQKAGNDPMALQELVRRTMALGVQTGNTPLIQFAQNVMMQAMRPVPQTAAPRPLPTGDFQDVNGDFGEKGLWYRGLQDVNGNILPNSVRRVKEPTSGNVMTSEDAIRLENSEYARYLQQTKNIQTRAQAYETIVSAAAGARSQNPASQIALVFSYMKLLDPTSVVRETEYAVAANAAGVPERIRNLWNKLLDGAFLGEDQVNNIVAEALSQARSSKREQDRTIKVFSDKAVQRGLNPNSVSYDWWAGINLKTDEDIARDLNLVPGVNP